MPAGIQSGFIGEPSFMDNKNMCPQCGKMLINLPEGECCPACREMNLFADVRDYIRKEDVNEFEVADHFGLPVSRVKEWIRQGRIEYKETPNGVRVLSSGYCELCGQPVAFGIICPKCKHKLAEEERKKGYAVFKPGEETDDNKMRVMDKFINDGRK